MFSMIVKSFLNLVFQTFFRVLMLFLCIYVLDWFYRWLRLHQPKAALHNNVTYENKVLVKSENFDGLGYCLNTLNSKDKTGIRKCYTLPVFSSPVSKNLKKNYKANLNFETPYSEGSCTLFGNRLNYVLLHQTCNNSMIRYYNEVFNLQIFNEFVCCSFHLPYSLS